MKKELFAQPRILIFIYIALALIMVSSALLELNQSKNELIELMREQAHSLLEALITSSNNTLTINEHLEANYKERLLNNANLIRTLYERRKISNAILADISKQNNIYRINIFNRKGEKILSSHRAYHSDSSEKYSPREILEPIFSGKQDTLILGLKTARYQSGFRYAVAVAAEDRSAIVLNLDAQQLLELRKEIGFGVLLRKIIDNPGIVYAALQDTSTILAASGNVRQLEAISESPFLAQALTDSLYLTRTIEFDTLEVFEAIHPFIHHGIKIGLFRLGISLEPLQMINARIYRRLVIITIVLIIFGSILFTFLFIRQRYDILKKQYQEVETYSSNIIHHVSDAIIVVDKQRGIKIFNSAAQRLFQTEANSVLGLPLKNILNDDDCHEILNTTTTMQQIECLIKSEKKYLLVSKSLISDREGDEIIILVIRDLSEQRRMEAQIQRKERLSAMGELASGVAHEIRNPLNTIGTIIQQLDKDFSPSNDKEEYHQLARLVYQEVRRINETVQDFLKFSRPEPVHPETFNLSDLFNHLKQQYRAMLDEQRIKLNIKLGWQGNVRWDRRQMQQVFMNLIQNSADAIGKNGTIDISINALEDGELEIKVIDDGPGISENIRSKIFNLYFTTKPKGTGIGLSIVQRIIYEHNGIIFAENNKDKGTIFFIKMPINMQRD
jgi:PAS domain S-box-containing protein